MIRQALAKDASRIAEILVFSKRTNYRRIFHNDAYSFGELQVCAIARTYQEDSGLLARTWVYIDNETDAYTGEHIELVKGLVEVQDSEIKTLYTDPFFTDGGIGHQLISFAKENLAAEHLWVLEKNHRAIDFYERNGFRVTGKRIPEEGTPEFLIEMKLEKEEVLNGTFNREEI